MATIKRKGLIHVRKTIAFDGTANNGLLGDTIPCFTTTGRVFIDEISVYASEQVTCSAPTQTNLQFKTSDGSYVLSLTSGWDYTTGVGFINRNDELVGAAGSLMYSNKVAVASNILLLPFDAGTGANVTDGTLVIDCWYRPISDDGALVGDDSDEGTIDGYDLEEAMRLVLSALTGIVTGAGTSAIVFRDVADTKDRITATIDAAGNRSGITRDAS